MSFSQWADEGDYVGAEVEAEIKTEVDREREHIFNLIIRTFECEKRIAERLMDDPWNNNFQRMERLGKFKAFCEAVELLQKLKEEGQSDV